MDESQLFGVLRCGGIEIAVSGSDLMEAVSLGAGLMPAAMGPPYVLGLLDLRGSPVPVIDLPVLLGRGAAPAGGRAGAAAPIAAVIDHAGHMLAIAADELGPLLQVQPAEIHPIEQNAGDYPAVLKAVIPRPGGGGMAQVLDLAVLLTSSSLLLTRSRQRKSKAVTEPRTVHLVFACAGRSFALPAVAVQEIMEDQTIEHSPFTGGGCKGLVRSRGRVVPVIDAARLLGLPVAPRQQRVELVVMLTPEGLVALQVSQREDIVAWRATDIVPTAAMGEVRPGLIRGLARNGGGEVFVLDPDAVAAPDVRALTKGHRDLYGKLDGAASEVRQGMTATAAEASRAYLIFEAGLSWMVAMEQVVEIIAAPDPAELRGALAARSAGVLTHRSRSVSFVDLCGLVGADHGPEPHGIIVEAAGAFFGFQVSRVTATAKAAIRRMPMRILSTSRGEDPALVRRHACFVSWTEAAGIRSAVLLDLPALALEAYGRAETEARPAEAAVMV
jgi:purine-binding chemotaxis protein CheW